MKKVLLSILLALSLISCGGGGDAARVPEPFTPVVQTDTRGMTLAFEELWEPRVLPMKPCANAPVTSPRTPSFTPHPGSDDWNALFGNGTGPCTQEPDYAASNGVFGTVSTYTLVATPDGSDPQQPWAANAITGRWGTLAGLDGAFPSHTAITGIESKSWSVHGGKLAFVTYTTAEANGDRGAYALISRQTFPRDGSIVVEADMDLVGGSSGSFAGLTLIAGEGDYREVAFRRNGGVDYIKRNAPLRETVLGTRTGTDPVTFRIDYNPTRGDIRYYANGVLLGVEALDHEGASFSADPQVGLYFADGSLQNPVTGLVGPVRVWTGPSK